MEQKYKVIRCPKCGGIDLTARYQASADETGRWKTVYWGGIFGLIYHLIRGSKKGQAYWECNECGYTFPDYTPKD